MENIENVGNIGHIGNTENKTDKAKPKKVGTLVSAYIEQKAYEALLRHCEATGQSKTKAIERAIFSYCKLDNDNDDNGNNGDGEAIR